MDTIFGLIFSLFRFIFSVIYSILKWIFNFFLGVFGGVRDNRRESSLRNLLSRIEKTKEENEKLSQRANALVPLMDSVSSNNKSLSNMVAYCKKVEGQLSSDYDKLDRSLMTLTDDKLDMIVSESKPMEKFLSSIHYPMTSIDIESLEKQLNSKDRFIDSLLAFARVNNLHKEGEKTWRYTRNNIDYKLDYHDDSGSITITAKPIDKITFTDNPRRPWQPSDVSNETLAYFNQNRELEFKIVRSISEIDHYDVSEIFEYMARVMKHSAFNPYARKKVLSYNEADTIDCDILPEFNYRHLSPTAPPPAEFLPDNQKMYGGKQRWAQIHDLESTGMLLDEGFIIGKIGYGTYIHTGPYDSHIMTVASVGSGKGVGVVIPNLLRHKGSAVILDPKGENLITTAHKRSQLGNRIFYYDPWEVMPFYNSKFRRNVVPEAISAHINPFDFINPNAPDMGDVARMFASSMIVRSDPNGDFFYNGAESLITKLIVYICTYYPVGNRNRNLLYLRHLLAMPSKDLLHNEIEVNHSDMLSRGKIPHPLFTELKSWLKTNIDSRSKSFNDIYSFALQATEFITSPQVAATLRDSNIDILKLKTSPMSLYLVLDMDKLLFVGDMYKPLVRLIITTCMLGASSRDNAKYKLLFMLDEIAQLGNLQYLPNLMSIYRSKGVVIWTIWQNLEQMKKNYEKDWESMVGNCDVQQYFGVNDQSTAEMVSKAAGNTTIYKEAYTSTEGESRGETIAKSNSDQNGWSKGSTSGTSSSNTYQGFNFSMTSGDSKSTSDSVSGSNTYSFSRSIQISTSVSRGTTLTKETVPLITPYEVMAGGACGVQFVFYRSRCPYPILSGKIKYWNDLEFYGEASENLTRR